LPELDKLAQQYQGRVGFLAVSLNSDRRRIRVSAQELHLHLPLAAAESELLGPLGLETVPATFLVDANGMMVARIEGGGLRRNAGPKAGRAPGFGRAEADQRTMKPRSSVRSASRCSGVAAAAPRVTLRSFSERMSWSRK